ncbi:MAG: hypothetical protein ACTSSF_09735, partial [Candidatus Heimdallarchaeaceae archaeon]
VETTLATEITNLFWTNYKVNQTSLEGAFAQTKEAYNHAHNLATFLYITLSALATFILGRVIVEGILATAWWIITTCGLAAMWPTLIVTVLLIIAIIVILMIVWGVTHVPWPLGMKDYNGETETKI